MSIYELMHDSQNEADRNPEAFFRKVETKIDPILYQLQLDHYIREFGQINISCQVVPQSALGEDHFFQNP